MLSLDSVRSRATWADVCTPMGFHPHTLNLPQAGSYHVNLGLVFGFIPAVVTQLATCKPTSTVPLNHGSDCLPSSASSFRFTSVATDYGSSFCLRYTGVDKPRKMVVSQRSSSRKTCSIPRVSKRHPILTTFEIRC